MGSAEKLITENLDVWSAVVKKKTSTGRGSTKKIELYGISKLRGLIYDLAMRGLLVPQDTNDESATVLLEKIATEKSKLVENKQIKKSVHLPKITNEEELYLLPVGWEWARLGELSANIHYGYTASALPENAGVRLLRITDIQNDRVNWSTVPGCEISEDKSRGYLLENNDILIARTGGTIGKSYLVENIKVKAVFASYLIRVTRISEMYSAFVKTYLGSGIYWNQLYDNASGTGQPNVNATALKSLLVPIAPLEEQHRIVAKVDELMALCDQLEQQQEASISAHETLVETLLAALANAADKGEFNQAWERIAEHFDTLFTTEHSVDQLKQTILQLAVMGKLVPQNPNDEPASVLLEKIAAEKEQLIKDKKIKKQKALPGIKDDEKPFDLPDGWKWVNIGDISTLMSGKGFRKSEYSSAGARLFQIANVSLGYTKWDVENYMPMAYLEEYPELRLSVDDVLIALNRPLLNKKMKICIISEGDLPAILYQRVGKFDFFGSTINTKFFYYFAQSNLFIDHLLENLQGSDQPISVGRVLISPPAAL